MLEHLELSSRLGQWLMHEFVVCSRSLHKCPNMHIHQSEGHGVVQKPFGKQVAAHCIEAAFIGKQHAYEIVMERCMRE